MIGLGRERVCAIILTRLGPSLPVRIGRHFTLGITTTPFQTLAASVVTAGQRRHWGRGGVGHRHNESTNSCESRVVCLLYVPPKPADHFAELATTQDWFRRSPRNQPHQPQAVETEPGAWDRFGHAVDAAVKSGPKHRVAQKPHKGNKKSGDRRHPLVKKR